MNTSILIIRSSACGFPPPGRGSCWFVHHLCFDPEGVKTLISPGEINPLVGFHILTSAFGNTCYSLWTSAEDKENCMLSTCLLNEGHADKLQ